MFRGLMAYLYQGTTVVVNKEDITNAKDEDFTEVRLALSDEFIKDLAEEIELLEDY